MKVLICRRTPDGYNEVSSPPEDGRRVKFDSIPTDARFVTAAELKLQLELEVVSAAKENAEEVTVAAVRFLVDALLCEMVLEMLLPLKEIVLEEAELDITAPETWGSSAFDPHICVRAVSLTL